MAQYITLNKEQKEEILNAIKSNNIISSNIDFTDLIKALSSQLSEQSVEAMDLNNSIVYSEGDQLASVSNNSITLTWYSGTALGFTLSFPTVIKSDVEKITLHADIRNAYAPTNELYFNTLGLRADYTPYQYMGYTWSSWLVKYGLNETNTEIDIELDTSDIETDSYFYICAGGWNVTYTNINLHYKNGTTETLSIADSLIEINKTLKEISDKIGGNE